MDYPEAANTGTVHNLTEGDILKSFAAGAANTLANGAISTANFFVAIGDITGNAEPFPHVQLFTPTSNYFASEGAATAEGLSLVTGATAFGRGVAGFAEGGVVQLGGAHGEVKGIPGNESHHMPADSVSPLSKDKGPAISMEKADHRQTASWGNSREARAYRAEQAERIKNGDFAGAQRMDIHDIQSKFGTKYNEAIRQVIEYTKGLF